MVEIVVPKIQSKWIALFIDGIFWKKVNKQLFIRHLGSPLMRQEFAAIEEKVAKETSIQLLAKRSYLSSMLERKLKSKGLGEQAIRQAIAFCQEKGYLNDFAESKRLIEREERKGRGAKAIAFALQQRGMVVSYQMMSELERREINALKEWQQKYSKKLASLSSQKKITFLLRRGYAMETILQLQNS